MRKIPILIILLFVFATLVSIYSQQTKRIPIAYWDEMQWVGQSYLFEFFIRGNFDKRLWSNFNSIEQPTLVKFSYGAWLYANFLLDKKSEEKNLDYTKYLIGKGFYFIDTYIPEYVNYHRSLAGKVPEIQSEDEGYPDYYYKKYGGKIRSTLDFIYLARKINYLYLALAVICAVIFIYKQKGLIFSGILTLFYGFNWLLIRDGIRAHTEGLFILLFNISLIMLIYYFLKKETKYLIAFSIFTGLSTAAKLNGIMLYVLFVVLNFSFNFSKKESSRKAIAKTVAPVFIAFTIFVMLNPFTYSNPILKIIEMYKFRSEHAYALSQYFHEAALKTPVHSLVRTFYNFFNNRSVLDYNVPIFIQETNHLGTLMLIFFVLGLLSEIKLIRKGNKFSFIFFVTFIYILIIMSLYLRLNWDRYFIQLVLFFVYYQICGFVAMFSYLTRFKLNKK